MSSYGFYLFVDAIRDLVEALAPVLVVLVFALSALVAWRWYLARNAGFATERLDALETRVRELERTALGGRVTVGEHAPEHREQSGEDWPDQEPDDAQPRDPPEGGE